MLKYESCETKISYPPVVDSRYNCRDCNPAAAMIIADYSNQMCDRFSGSANQFQC